MSKFATAAIYFVPEAYSISGEKLMGRNAAGQSFLEGYFRHGKCDTFWAYVKEADDLRKFHFAAQEINHGKKIEGFLSADLGLAEHAGTLYYPGPDLADMALKRAQFGSGKWSLCGITHTTSSARAMDSIASWLTAPLEPWDAIICTSIAVKRNVELILDSELARLKRRLGVTKVTLPELPVIPLGINTDDFVFSDTERAAARAALKLERDTVAVLYVGRLSFHAKAHPLAMYQALEVAATKTKKDIVLIECGWFANEYARKAFEEAASVTCPSVRIVRLDGREQRNRALAWSGADIFCSLADNIQETFGITPIEAMAAGLPCVVTDWDGYKDTISEDVGFRTPTSIPAPGLGQDLANRHASNRDNYDFYCGHTCLFVGVDIEATVESFIRLIENENLRKEMGAAGRLRARNLYDWAKIIPQYEDLWGRLATARQLAGKVSIRATPTRLDPYYAFSHYATDIINIDSEIELTEQDIDLVYERLDLFLSLEMIKFGDKVLPSRQTLRQIISEIALKPTGEEGLFGGHDKQKQLIMTRALGFLHKLGLVRLTKPTGAGTVINSESSI